MKRMATLSLFVLLLAPAMATAHGPSRQAETLVVVGRIKTGEGSRAFGEFIAPRQ